MLEWKLLFARVVSAPPAVLTDTSAHPDLSSVVRLFLVSTFKQTLHPYRPFSLPRWLFSVCLCDFRKRWFHRGWCEISEKPPAECIYYPVWTPPCLQILNGSVNMSWHINSKYMKPFGWHIFRNIVCQIPCVCRTRNEIGASHPERDIQGRSWLCEYGLCPQKDAMQGLNLVNKRLCDSAPSPRLAACSSMSWLAFVPQTESSTLSIMRLNFVSSSRADFARVFSSETLCKAC